MGYMHIQNLYKDQTILLFKECYALEKIHGTSAHIKFSMAPTSPALTFFSGGEKHERFKALFNDADLCTRFEALGHTQPTAAASRASLTATVPA